MDDLVEYTLRRELNGNLKCRHSSRLRGDRASFRSSEIQIFDSSRNVERTIPFSEADRILASLRWDLVLLQPCPRAGARYARTVCTASFCFRRLRARGLAARHSRCFRV
jgi:hypothetical protein